MFQFETKSVNQFQNGTALLAGRQGRESFRAATGNTGVTADSKLQTPLFGAYSSNRQECRRFFNAADGPGRVLGKRSPIPTRRIVTDDDASDGASDGGGKNAWGERRESRYGGQTGREDPAATMRTESRQRVPAKPVTASTTGTRRKTNPAAAKATAQAAKLARRDRVVLEHMSHW